MTKQRSDLIAGGLVLTFVGALCWWGGLGFIALPLWAIVACAALPNSVWPKTRTERRIEAARAEALTDRINADRKTRRRREMEDWDREYRRLDWLARIK
jgi:hypothetical protein